MAETKKALVERLFAERSGPLRAFFYRRLHHRPDAAELTQEVYVRILRMSDTDVIRNPDAFLYTVASNLAKERRVLAQRYVTGIDTDGATRPELMAELPDVMGQVDTLQRINRLREVLQQLSPKCRAAVLLQYWHGMSREEIAVQLGVSTNMVKKYLSQALAHCRRRMARLG
jgi:RNA polymerase sigma-70 factor (ECF subfamily)